jgi:hypothetical protein
MGLLITSVSRVSKNMTALCDLRKIFESGSSAASRRVTESFSGIESFYGMLGRGAQKKMTTT